MNFDKIRSLFAGHKISQAQVDGVNFIVKGLAGWSPEWQACGLGNTFHETGQAMVPVYEHGNHAYFDKYEPGTVLGRQLGNTKKGDGFLFRGVGYCQITGRANFRKFGLEHSPADAARPDIAISILRLGMEHGLFTGKKLSDFTKPSGFDYYNARTIINGHDKAVLITKYCQAFHEALK